MRSDFSRLRQRITLVLVGLSSLFVAADARALGPYLVTEMRNFRALALNDVGQASGSNSLNSTAAIWHNGVITDLGGQNAAGEGINNSGDVAGTVMVSGQQRPFLYTNGGGMTLLPISSGVAYDLNASRLVVGERPVQTSFGLRSRAFFYPNQSGGVGEVPFGGSEYDSWAVAVNDAGVILGHHQQGVVTSPFRYSESGGIQFVDLDRAMDINNAGDVVGTEVFSLTDVQGHIVLSNGTRVPLGELAGYDQTYPRAVNDGRVVVGEAQGLSPGDAAGFIWTQQDGIVNVNSLLATSDWHIGYLMDVNESGQLLAFGRNPQGSSVYALLTPVPEPAALAVPVVVIVAALLSRRARGSRIPRGAWDFRAIPRVSAASV